MPTSRPLKSVLFWGLIITAAMVGGCADKAVSPTTNSRARVRVEAAISAQANTARSVAIAVSYAQTSGARVTIAEQTDEVPADAIAAGTKDITLDVDLEDCLADPDRAGNGGACALFVHIVLSDGNGVALDSTDAGPVNATAGAMGVPVILTVRAASSISVAPPGPDTAIVTSLTRQLVATLKDASGAVLSDRLITWQSSAPLVAAVNQSGLVTAVGGSGSATITARNANVTASVLVSVRPPQTTTVNISTILDNATSLPANLGNLHVGQVLRVIPFISVEPGFPTTVVLSSSTPAITIGVFPLVNLVAPGPSQVCVRWTLASTPGGCINLLVLP